mmetsp:Transcript_9637/g.22921  ORF Transcript_9637/g.22921 Transcript_9637/m.22921 type:complete len:312 (-) Transcript_9637:1014-1949(-)
MFASGLVTSSPTLLTLSRGGPEGLHPIKLPCGCGQTAACMPCERSPCRCVIVCTSSASAVVKAADCRLCACVHCGLSTQSRSTSAPWSRQTRWASTLGRCTEMHTAGSPNVRKCSSSELAVSVGSLPPMYATDECVWKTCLSTVDMITSRITTPLLLSDPMKTTCAPLVQPGGAKSMGAPEASANDGALAAACASGSGAARRKNFSAAAGSSAKRCPGTPQSMHEAQCSVSYEHFSAQLAVSFSHACSQRAAPRGRVTSSVYCGAALCIDTRSISASPFCTSMFANSSLYSLELNHSTKRLRPTSIVVCGS